MFDDTTMEEIKARAVAEMVERAWPKFEAELLEIKLLSVNQAAGLADISTSQMRRIIEESVDLGEQTSRLSVGYLKRLYAKRTVKRKPKL